jgi:hypothetical protein
MKGVVAVLDKARNSSAAFKYGSLERSCMPHPTESRSSETLGRRMRRRRGDPRRLQVRSPDRLPSRAHSQAIRRTSKLVKLCTAGRSSRRPFSGHVVGVYTLDSDSLSRTHSSRHFASVAGELSWPNFDACCPAPGKAGPSRDHSPDGKTWTATTSRESGSIRISAIATGLPRHKCGISRICLPPSSRLCTPEN